MAGFMARSRVVDVEHLRHGSSHMPNFSDSRKKDSYLARNLER